MKPFLLAPLLMLAAPAAVAEDSSFADPSHFSARTGGEVYRGICQGCHMPDARGATGAGTYPALAKDANLESAAFAAATVLSGRRDMPAFGPRTDLQGFEAMLHVDLDDAQIAAVVNYIRSHFGNHYADTLSAADVAALHPPTPHKP